MNNFEENTLEAPELPSLEAPELPTNNNQLTKGGVTMTTTTEVTKNEIVKSISNFETLKKVFKEFTDKPVIDISTDSTESHVVVPDIDAERTEKVKTAFNNKEIDFDVMRANIKTSWNKVKEGVFETANYLREVKQILQPGTDQDNFKYFCKHYLPFTYETALRLIKVSECTYFEDKDVYEKLPSTWTILHKMSTLSEEDFEKVKEFIHSDISVSEISKLLNVPKTPKPKDTSKFLGMEVYVTKQFIDNYLDLDNTNHKEYRNVLNKDSKLIKQLTKLGMTIEYSDDFQSLIEQRKSLTDNNTEKVDNPMTHKMTESVKSVYEVK
jgi:hypothetical protein